jgi:hypothetical protein
VTPSGVTLPEAARILSVLNTNRSKPVLEYQQVVSRDYWGKGKGVEAVHGDKQGMHAT